jgi:hypothetical protein
VNEPATDIRAALGAETEATPPVAAPATPGGERDAVILVPGLASEWGDRTLEAAAERIAGAFDRNAATGAARFSVKLEVGEEEFGPNLRTRVCTILRADASATTPVLDLYGFEYRAAMTERFERRPLVIKALLVLLAVMVHLPRVIRAMVAGKKAGKTLKETLQVLYGMAILLLLSAYLALLVWALVQSVTSIPELGGSNPGVTVPQILVVAGAALGFLFPGIRAWVVRGAIGYVALIHYLSVGERREVLQGRLAALFEHVGEKQTPSYGRVHVLAYSFGSIVALDAVFPRGRDPVRRVELLDTLVTIGTPYDAIRSWWPKYFSGRHAMPGRPARWVNVYAPADVLGSNFRNDSVAAPASESVHLEEGRRGPLPENVAYAVGPSLDEVGPLGVITLVGLRAHALYWDEDEEAETVYGVIIPRLYAGTAAMG